MPTPAALSSLAAVGLLRSELFCDSIEPIHIADYENSVAAFLANSGRKVSVVFESADAVLASKTPMPDAVRKSRCVRGLLQGSSS